MRRSRNQINPIFQEGIKKIGKIVEEEVLSFSWSQPGGHALEVL
jgi:hypothetical protein